VLGQGVVVIGTWNWNWQGEEHTILTVLEAREGLQA
jgi:hypothetical protein